MTRGIHLSHSEDVTISKVLSCADKLNDDTHLERHVASLLPVIPVLVPGRGLCSAKLYARLHHLLGMFRECVYGSQAMHAGGSIPVGQV